MKKITMFFLSMILLIVFTDKSSAQSSLVKMNEVFSRGTTADPDWIEIYNGSASAVDISSYKIYDSGGKGGTKDKKGFPAGTTVAAKGFYVMIVDGSAASDFGLSNGGEEVWLEDGTGTVIDDVTFPALAAGETYARVPDGSTTWKILTSYTRGSTNGTGTGINNDNTLITNFNLQQNYPNPFNPSTDIRWQINAGSHVTLKVYSLLGKEVATLVDEYKPAGNYNSVFKAQNLSITSGIYFYTLRSGNYSLTKKMTLVK
jgi:hypothetical protein